MWSVLKRNPISAFAVLCVMATALYLAYISGRLIAVLESPSWCGKALQAEKISSQNFGGLTACKDLLMLQVPILGTALHIVVGGFVLCLVVLVVVVVAGAKASGKLPGGVSFDVSREVEQKVDQVAGAAVEEAEAVKEGL